MANQTFSIRLSDEYINIFNKLHEQANEANPISKSAFFEKVLDFFANPKVKEVEVVRDTPETTAKLEKQQQTIEELQSEKDSLLARLQEYEGKLDENTANTTRLQEEYSNKQQDYLQQIKSLQEQVNEANNRSVLDIMKDFPSALLLMTAQRLTQKYKRNITPVDVLSDMFLRYTIERWSKWFYDWVLTDDEIVAEAKKINPNITSIKQLKNFVIK